MKIEKKCGVIVTYHNHANDIVIPCLNSILKYTPKPRYILVFDNESTDINAINLPKKYGKHDIEFIRVSDQLKNGGLTGTWNQGIKKCLENECNKVILLNHDTKVDKSWPIFIEKIKSRKFIYGPISNRPGKNKALQKNTKKYSLKRRDVIRKTIKINGFCLGFTKEALELNKFNKKYYFDPKYPFRNNEFEWQERFKEKGGKAAVIEGCFVFHHKDNSWKENDEYNSNNEPKNLNQIINKKIGEVGIILKSNLPKLYKKLKPYFPDR